MEDIAEVDQAHALGLSVFTEVKSSPEALDALEGIPLHPPVQGGKVVGRPAGLLFLQYLGNTVPVL